MAFPCKNSWLPLIFFFSFFSMFLLTAQRKTASGYDDGKQLINIVNIIEPKTVLRVHCKSGDDDLGEKKLWYGQSWDFEFKPNWWGTTLYFCRFSWNGQSRLYDVYDHSWPDARRGYWEWRISAKGPCTTRYRREPGVFYCYPW